MTIATTNPATGELVRSYQTLSSAQVEDCLRLAAEAQTAWAVTRLEDRTGVLLRAAELLDAEAPQLAELAALEMGKQVRAGRDEVAKCAGGLRYYAEHAAHMLKPIRAELPGEVAYVRRQPLGTILAVMPWNFPFWQVIRFAAPALAAGNTVLLKHASNVPQCALAVEDIFRRAGAPQGVFQTLLIEASQVEGVLRDTRVSATTLTGSEGAGSSVASIAGSVLKKSVLELGGSDPFIVLASADIGAAAAAAARGRTVNSGQSCIASKRFIIVESCAAEFEELFVHEMESLVVGSPLNDDTDLGPLATSQVRADVHQQVTEAVRKGARIATGGTPLPGPGWYYPPTVLLDADTESSVWQDEVFGPVAPVVRVPNSGAALALANNSRYGLGASVWTMDRNEVLRFTEELQCGMVFVNAIVHSDARLPFGGIKRSGFGRELADMGLHEFTNAKTIRIPAALSAGS